MNKSNKLKTMILFSLSSVAIILLFFVNVDSVQTSQEEYANYFASLTQDSANLTRAYQDEIGLWQLGEISNETMAELTNNYLVNFTTQMNKFNQTQAPDSFESAKKSLVNSFYNEIKSYQVFSEYLLTGNESLNEISTNFLSESLKDEVMAFESFKEVTNKTSR
jgi:hypothetical protein